MQRAPSYSFPLRWEPTASWKPPKARWSSGWCTNPRGCSMMRGLKEENGRGSPCPPCSTSSHHVIAVCQNGTMSMKILEIWKKQSLYVISTFEIARKCCKFVKVISRCNHNNLNRRNCRVCENTLNLEKQRQS